MILLITGLIIFLGIHSISIVALPLRDAMAQKLGPIGWRAVYGLISLVGIVLVIKGYGDARLNPTLIWAPPIWTRHIVAVLMLPVFVFFVAAYLPGRISAALKHPMLVAVKLWALAHLLANGMLADIILFGAFLAWAIVDRISMKRRAPRSHLKAPEGKLNDVIAVLVGLAVYVLFVIRLHVAWIGVAPFG